MRVSGEFLNYPNEISSSVIESSAGVNQLYFSQFKNKLDLKIYDLPRYQAEALIMLMSCTDMRIDKLSYTKQDGPIEWSFNRTMQTMTTAVTVYKKTQDYKNYY
jgi:hypothetical protein